MIKHTPGPWREGTMNVWQDDLLLCVAKTERGEYHNGEFEPYRKGDSREQMQADARLIAAAPELLAALKECSEWMREHTGPAGGTLDMLTRAHDAIKKAEGRP